MNIWDRISIWRNIGFRRLVGKKFRKSVFPLRRTCALWAVRKDDPSRYPRFQQREHGLPSNLYISLTSYPRRFSTLHLTLRSLIDQTVRPNAILLWIAHDDVARLPSKVLDLEKRGVIIRACEDLRSYKKLVPAIQEWPGAFFVTADDDLYYPPRWLETLVDGFDVSCPTVVCHRAHRLKWDGEGVIAAYVAWEKDVQDPSSRTPSADIMPTTGAGAMFYPGCFSSGVTDKNLFQEVCPEADDLWFYWHTRIAGTLHRKVGGRLALVAWPTSQEASLYASNEAGGNDRQIKNLLTVLGRPQPVA